MSFDLEVMRAQLPALAITDAGMHRIYFGNLGGTKLPVRVTDAITTFLLIKNGLLAHFFAYFSVVSLRPTFL